MAFDKYKDGAWQEPETTVSRYDKTNGYWTDCEAAKRIVDGAWSEIWANIKYMIQLSNSVTKGILTIDDKGLEFDYFRHMGYYSNKWYGSQSGGGAIVFYLDGEWTDPTISFDWSGGFINRNTDTSTWTRISAGQIKIYSRAIGSTEQVYTTAVQTVGSMISNASFVEEEDGSYTGTLTGTFDRIGLSLNIAGYSGNYDSSSTSMVVKNLKLNGRKIGFPESSEFDNQEWA